MPICLPCANSSYEVKIENPSVNKEAAIHVCTVCGACSSVW